MDVVYKEDDILVWYSQVLYHTVCSKKMDIKTEVTSVKLVLFKYVMSFETLTKVDWLTEIVRFG